MFTGFVRDITARKRAEEAIRFQAQLLDTVEQAVIATDADGIIIYWNRFAETLYGWSAPEALGRYVVDVTAAPTSQAEAEQILARLRAGQSWSGEFIVQRRDGTTFPTLVTDAPVYDDAGNVIAIVGVSLDITERKQAEETAHFLAAASAVLASSLDDATILENLARLAVPRVADWCVVDMVAAGGTFRRSAVAHVDPAKVELLDALERRYPTDPNAPHGYPLVIRTGQPELIPEISGALLAAVATDAAHLEMLRALGLRSNLCVPLTARGRTIGALTLATAESRRIYGPADLALAEDLAHRAALAIDNARLYQEAQTAIRLRDEFLSVAAHELKTPVTGLLGYAQLLERRAAREPATNERVRHAVRVIGAQAERLSRLVESLLDVSRLETGSFVLDRQPVDLCALVREVGQETQPALHRHTLECICDAGPVAVEADRLRLEQVIQNLLQNAIKYSPEGGPIMLRVERHADHAALIVSDQGVGIPQEARPHLFERFYRASNIAGSNISGIGIGLYLANEIVTRHGGTIEVTSTEGAGSTFTVRLPLAPFPTGAG